MVTFNLNRHLVTINRWSGYLLIVFMLLFFATGIGILKGVMPRRDSKFIHEILLPVPTFIAFLVHSILSIRFILIRKAVKDMFFWNTFLVVLGVFLFMGFIRFYLR